MDRIRALLEVEPDRRKEAGRDVGLLRFLDVLVGNMHPKLFFELLENAHFSIRADGRQRRPNGTCQIQTKVQSLKQSSTRFPPASSLVIVLTGDLSVTYSGALCRTA